MEIVRLAALMRLLAVSGSVVLLVTPSVLVLLGVGLPGSPDPVTMALAWGAGTTPNLALAWGFWRLSAGAGRIAAGDAFTPAVAVTLRQTGGAILLASFLFPLMRGILYLGTGGGIGPGVIVATLVGGLFGTAFYLFGRLMAEAVRLAEDNAGFV